MPQDQPAMDQSEGSLQRQQQLIWKTSLLYPRRGWGSYHQATSRDGIESLPLLAVSGLLASPTSLRREYGCLYVRSDMRTLCLPDQNRGGGRLNQPSFCT